MSIKQKTQKKNNDPANAVWAIREVVKSIFEWAKPHPNMILLEKAKLQTNQRYWEALRLGLIGPETGKVRILLQKYLAYRRRFHTSKIRLYALEERIGAQHLQSYTIDECWNRFDGSILTFMEKLRLSDATQFRINADFNKKLVFIKLKRIINMSDHHDTCYLEYIDDNDAFFRDYDQYGGLNPDDTYVPCSCQLRDRVWDLLSEDEYDYWNESQGLFMLDAAGL